MGNKKNKVNITGFTFRKEMVERYGKTYISNFNDFNIKVMETDINELAKYFDRDMNKAILKLSEGMTTGTYNAKDKYFTVINDNIMSVTPNEYSKFINEAFAIVNVGVWYEKARIPFEPQEISFEFIKDKLKALGVSPQDENNFQNDESEEGEELENEDNNYDEPNEENDYEDEDYEESNDDEEWDDETTGEMMERMKMQ